MVLVSILAAMIFGVFFLLLHIKIRGPGIEVAVFRNCSGKHIVNQFVNPFAPPTNYEIR